MACHASAYLKNQRISTQIRDNHLDRVEEVSAHPVHFVHKADPGHSILVSLHTHTQSWLHHTQARFDRGGRADVLNMPSWFKMAYVTYCDFPSTHMHLSVHR